MSATNKLSKSRKRKRNIEFKLKSKDLDNAEALEEKVRKVAEENELSEEEIQQMVKKIVKNENFLALVTLKRETSKEQEQRAILITETPSVQKLTRKARELNNGRGRVLQTPLDDSLEYEITTLINADLCSDDDDGEYLFNDEDFISDDDPSITNSDLDSNPHTPNKSQTLTSDVDLSPVKYTEDGCFKIPLDKRSDAVDDLRISTRTRSKVCLENLAIEDIESEFIPPDVDYMDITDNDFTLMDTEWMRFLNEFTRPLNCSAVEEDDPISDPEYVASEKVPVDAEELRPVNISKKELADLFAELLNELDHDGICLENINEENSQENTLPLSDVSTTIFNDIEAPQESVQQLEVEQQPINNENPAQTKLKALYNRPFDGNYTHKYISIKKHIYKEYEEKFNNAIEHDGFMQKQQPYDQHNVPLPHEILQQQLRIHVQMLTQTYLQIYCHPDLWKLAPQIKKMLVELHENAQSNANFRAINLPSAIALIKQWEDELAMDTDENKELMK